MKEANIDVSVLLIFFTRHEQFKQVFEQVKKARPSRLFLYQDGPRENRLDDIENINKCRAIAEDIDWKCEVYRFYQEKNIGVDPSGYLADKWAFSLTDKCIVLEDDVVPSVSFFSFCKEMLDKYENDHKVMLISGFNVEECTKDIKSDYFFSSTTFTWGWASWSRVVNQWDSNYTFLSNNKKRKEVQEYIDNKNLVKNMMNIFENHLNSGKEHFETILISNQYLNRGLTIVPTKNMINNIGIVDDSAHYSGDIFMIAKGLRRIFTMKRYEIDLEDIKEPKHIEDYEPYKNNSYRIYGWGHPMVKIYRLIETTYYKIIRGKGGEVVKDILDKFKKVLNKTTS